MKGGCTEYPNKGVKIDPRAITSARMPESLRVYSGFLNHEYFFLMTNGFLQKKDIKREKEKIEKLLPYKYTLDKLKSSHWFYSDTHLVEFFRTSRHNFKIYVLRTVFFEEYHSLFGTARINH